MKTISAGELPGMRAAKPVGEELEGWLLLLGAGVRAKALFFFVFFCFCFCFFCPGGHEEWGRATEPGSSFRPRALPPF